MPVVTAIDYGMSTGVAIATVGITDKNLRVSNILINTYTNHPESVILQVIKHHSTHVVIEARPQNSSPIGLQTYETLYQRLMSLSTISTPPFQLTTIGPSRWKPFMRLRQQDVKACWDTKTKHEMEAASLLEYALRVLFGFRLEVIHV